MNIEITMDHTRFHTEEVWNLIKDAYWTQTRTFEIMDEALKHSDKIGVFYNQKLIGFARIVTDYATFIWLADVFVDPKYRGQGIGKQMMEHISSLPYYNQCKGVLLTKDAHKLYEKYGFYIETKKAMVKDRS